MFHSCTLRCSARVTKPASTTPAWATPGGRWSSTTRAGGRTTRGTKLRHSVQGGRWSGSRAQGSVARWTSSQASTTRSARPLAGSTVRFLRESHRILGSRILGSRIVGFTTRLARPPAGSIVSSSRGSCSQGCPHLIIEENSQQSDQRGEILI